MDIDSKYQTPPVLASGHLVLQKSLRTVELEIFAVWWPFLIDFFSLQDNIDMDDFYDDDDYDMDDDDEDDEDFSSERKSDANHNKENGKFWIRSRSPESCEFFFLQTENKYFYIPSAPPIHVEKKNKFRRFLNS